MDPLAPFRIVTLNLFHNAESRWQARAPLVLRELYALAPDIVLLQEVTWPQEQATALATALGGRTGQRYGVQLMALAAPNGWQEGLVVLSRSPILDQGELGIAATGSFCQRVRVDIGGRSLDIYNVHLTPYSSGQRRAQIDAALAWMRTCADADGVVLGGDLNATPESDVIKQVSLHLRSAYAVAHGREPEYTCPTPFGVERQRGEGRPIVFSTLDYLCLSSTLTVTDARLTFDRPADNDPCLYASDHYGLTADLDWTR